MYTMIPYRTRHTMTRPVMDSFLNDRFFRSFFDMDEMVGGGAFRVDVLEKPDQYVLEAELPGVQEDQISLSVEKDVLTISADLSQKKEDQEGAYLYAERRGGHMERAFRLEKIRQDDITATYRDGILTVILPKEKPDEDPGVRTIEIRHEDA